MVASRRCPRVARFGWRRILLVTVATLVAAALVGLCACAGGPPAQPKQSSSPFRGETLRLVGQPANLDPATWTSADDPMVGHCIYETLFAFAPGGGDAGLKLEPGLAAGMPKISADGTVYRVTLRDDSRFAPPVDRAVTATDVQYSFERMLREPLAWFTYFFSSIDGADEFIAGKGEHVRGLTVVDARTLEIHLTRPDATIPYAFSLYGSGVVPKEWVEKWGKDFGQHPLGSGPFAFVKWQQAGDVVLARNPNYRDAEHVWLDGVEFVPYAVKMADMMKVQRGALDVCWLSQPDWVKARSDPSWRPYVTEQLMVSTCQLFMNARLPPFDDVRVRQAFCWAVDRERLARIAGCKALWQILPESMPGFVEGAQWYGFDPARASRLLADAGYSEGLTVTLSYPAGESWSQAAEAIQQDLRRSGIRAKLEMLPSQAFWARAATPRSIALGLIAWGPMDFPDPSDWIGPLFTRASAVKNGSNYSFWWDPHVEAMIADAQATLDPDARIAKYSAIQRAISDQAPIVPIWQLLAATLNSPSVGGFYIHGVYMFDPEHYWKQPAGVD